MEGSSIDLKTFLGLANPNQYSQSVRKQISSWFWGDKLQRRVVAYTYRYFSGHLIPKFIVKWLN